MEDGELLERFLAGTLDAFAHRDHVRTAYLLLCAHSFDDATPILSDRIRTMAAAAGDPGKFHVTRTVAWMRLVDAARARQTAFATSLEFLETRSGLLRSSLLDDFYSPELLRSEGARAHFIEPDLRALSWPPANA